MKTVDYEAFFKGGEHCDGEVMVQLAHQVLLGDVTKEGVGPAYVNRRAMARQQAESELERPLTADEVEQIVKSIPDGDVMIPPVPVMVGELSRLGPDVLLLKYKTHRGDVVVMTIRPEDILHVFSAPKSRIVT